MTRFFALLGSCILFSGLSCGAQTIDEIVSKHAVAVGGDAAWKKVSSLKYTGSTNSNGTKVPYTRTVLNGKGLRYDMQLAGRPTYIIYTPLKGWSLFATTNDAKPSELPEQPVKSAYSDLFVSDPLIDYASKGASVKYAGKVKVAGHENYKLRYTDRHGNISFLFIDPSTYHINHLSQKLKVGTKGSDHTQTFMNYTTLPEGIVVAKEIRGAPGEGIIIYDSIEVNTVSDDGIFKP